jgi:hypothetical protein
MRGKRSGWRIGLWAALCLAMVVPVRSTAAAQHVAGCRKIVLTGEVNAGQEWKAAFGQGVGVQGGTDSAGEGWVQRLGPGRGQGARGRVSECAAGGDSAV